MREFFGKRKINLIILGIGVFLFIVGFILSFSKNEYIVWGLGKPLQWSFAVSSLLLFILFLLPVKVFKVWKYLGIIFSVYGFYDISSTPVFENCFMFICDRYAVAGFVTLYLSVLSLTISILLAIIWHFWEKHKQKKSTSQ